MQLWHIKTKVLILFSLLYAGNALNAEDAQQKALLNMLKKQEPHLYKKAVEIQKRYDEVVSQEGDVVYCLISESVSKEYMKNIVLEAGVLNAYKNTKLYFVLQGFFSQDMVVKYNELVKDIGEYEYADVFKANMELILSPKTFKKYKIKKVPALLYGTYKGAVSINESEINYIARGDISLYDFFKLISTKDASFEDYSNSISSVR